jgi:DNA-directed RNA polymerase specialized sigma24 family protein
VSALTATSFQLLLTSLDTVPAQAAEKYELLREKLVKCLAWKGCPEADADALADTVLDRVAVKLEKGEQIQNLKAYACEVMRLVWLEHLRRRKEDAVGDDKIPENFVEPEIEILKDSDVRMRCLRKCLAEVVPDESDRSLIVGYYDTEAGDKIKTVRKNLAEKLNLSANTMKVKACRIRDRLEKCINECVARIAAVTKPAVSVTNTQGGDPR